MNKSIRLLVVDDSALMRKHLVAYLQKDRRIDVIATARDGVDAVDKAIELRPDVITLDINMPKMDGLTALQHIMYKAPCPIIILSSLTQKGALITFEALELGAFDFINKPKGTISYDIEGMGKELLNKIYAAADSKGMGKSSMYRTRAKATAPSSTKSLSTNREIGTKSKSAIAKNYLTVDGSRSKGREREKEVLPAIALPERVVLIGVSTGGPKTLMDILPKLPAHFPYPILLIQHMPAHFTSSFAARLHKILPMNVIEARHRQPLEAGTIYLAPGGVHMHVDRPIGRNQLRLLISEKPADRLFKPSVDVTLFSLLKHFPAERIISVLLTGIGDDGAKAMAAVTEQGGCTIAESEETAIVFGMPKVAAELGGASKVLPSYEIADEIMREAARSLI
ncbi:protein-glutamate methylesterase/protein-glutamine glutaminase [Heliorestis convoluta]|uniref:Protein-glutamate methylesterase/protein-glutamine glutaminase n=1 Tax=Heliorestis convoluta TaxID=356322 RepID=A0A5Q2MZ46_9FIRM|nr:chemotaxis response regulator protein-glutamate methylesterase [Heliorestis convoluta]QGG46446.1 chemotaxis response regulator protein-glutamate methylesterase [Heliorestis convoluta]